MIQMSSRLLNKIASVVSLGILLGWSVYWVLQIIDVFELLRIADAAQ